MDVDFATLTKEYQSPPPEPAAHRYSPGSLRAIEKTVSRGTPDPEKISTSYVERFNLAPRMQVRRFTRLTNAFSKRLENHAAAIALYIAHCNLCCWHETLRKTPAMALGPTDNIWGHRGPARGGHRDAHKATARAEALDHAAAWLLAGAT